MAIPPPPPGPPGPPPPPIGNLKLGTSLGKTSGSGGDTRSALLSSIQKGTKLRKVTTVDKSGPIVVGRISNSTNSSNSGPPRPPPPNNDAQTNGTPKLGGIFEGMKTMPKLKPVGERTIGSRTSPPSESSVSTLNSLQNTNISNDSTCSDLNAELAKHLTLRKQKKFQQSNITNETNAKNRGPPPQPPTKTVTDNNISPTVVNNNNSITKQTNNVSNTTIKSNGTTITVAPNKSSLFGNCNNNNTISTTLATSNKIVPNHGKPNCAPKPPGIHQMIATKNGITTTDDPNNSRPIVSRHHSMRSPRSPPISVANNTTFPTTPHFGTIRGAPSVFQSQDAINASIRPSPGISISRPTVAPPRPPIEAKSAAVKEKEINDKTPRSGFAEKRSQGPPPPPIRSISNTNLTTLPLSVPSAISPSVVSNSVALNFGGSASNVSTLTNNIATSSTGSINNLAATKDRSPNISTNNVAPPLPPHRTCPAPPPPPVRQTSMTPANNNGGAPPVPQRHSSMRNSNPNMQATIVQQTIVTTTPNSTRTVARFVLDLDGKFGHAFHNVTEFPAPSPFTRFEKSYPSRATTGTFWS